MKKAIILLAVAGAASAAFGQAGTGKFTWEVSKDGGASWSGGIVDCDETQTSVLVRAVASWSQDAGYAFAGAQFDVAVTGPAGTDGDGDSTGGYSRISNGANVAQTVVESRFGETLKLDDSRDTSAPGAGTRGVFPGQLVQNFAGSNFTTSNPAVLFTFTYNLDGTLGARTIDTFFRAPTGGNTSDHFMVVYTTATGGQNRPLAELNGATINVIPAPGALALLGLGGLVAGRRRR